MGVNATGDGAGALRRAAEHHGRRTGLRALAFLVVAAGAAVGVAYLLSRYMDARTAAARVPTVPVVVAALDMPEATELRPESLEVVQWPAASLPQGIVSDPAALNERVLASRVYKGEPVLTRHVASSEAGRGLAALLTAGMRAVAVRVDDVVGVAGFIHPGDSVDVIVTMQAGSGPPMSKIVLQNIRVLAVGKQVERNDREMSKAMPATVATLMVNSDESEKLALAASKGQILLSLRSGLDKKLVATSGVLPPELLGGRSNPPPPAPPAPAPSHGPRKYARVNPVPVVSEVRKEKDSVEILRGDLFERRDFERGNR